MNPFDTSGTIENEPTFKKVRMPIPDEAAILIDLRVMFSGKGSATGAPSAVPRVKPRETVIGGPGELLDRAIAERNFTPHDLGADT